MSNMEDKEFHLISKRVKVISDSLKELTTVRALIKSLEKHSQYGNPEATEYYTNAVQHRDKLFESIKNH